MEYIEFKTISELIEKIDSHLVSFANGVGYQSYSVGGDTICPQKEQWQRLHQELMVHAEGWILPKIHYLRPNEDEKSQNHRILSYEPITTPFYQRALVQIKRVLLSSSVDVSTSEKLSEYMQQNNFNGLKLYDFFASQMSEQIINYPNGFTIIYPTDYAEKEERNPICFIRYQDVVYFDDDVIVFIDLHESEKRRSYRDPFCIKYTQAAGVQTQTGGSYVSFSQEEVITITKPVFHILTKTELAEVQSGKDGNLKDGWVIKTLAKFKSKTLPAFQNGGIRKSHHVFQSFFHNACYFGNLALNRHSDTDAVNAMFSYPQVSMESTECTECKGSGQKHTDHSGFYHDNLIDCFKCKGTGQYVIFSPYKTILRPKQTSNIDAPPSNQPPIEFHSPDVGILNYSQGTWQQYLEKFKEGLCLYDKVSNSAESGYSIELQLAPMLDFMQNFGVVAFGNFERILLALEMYLLKGAKPEVPTMVTRPISYHLQTEDDALKTLSGILESDCSAEVRSQILRSYINKYVGKRSMLIRFVDILEAIDPFYYYSSSQKHEILLLNGMTELQYRISVAGFGVLKSEIKKKENTGKSNDEMGAQVVKIISAWVFPTQSPAQPNLSAPTA